MTDPIENFDAERALIVCKQLSVSFHNRAGLLAEVDDLVENQIPPNVKPLSREHANFLFLTIPNDHGLKSSRLYTDAKRLYVDEPGLFDPVAVVREFSGPEDPGLVERTGLTLRTRYPRETARSWYANSAKLVDKFQGDGRAALASSDDAAKLLKIIQGFRGFGPKTGGMMLRAAVNLGFASVTEIDDVLVPVDTHDVRIAFLTRILRRGYEPGAHYNAPNTRAVQRGLRDACKSANVPWLQVDQALWLIGSRGCVTLRCNECPLRDLCEIGSAQLAGQTAQMSVRKRAKEASGNAHRRKKRVDSQRTTP